MVFSSSRAETSEPSLGLLFLIVNPQNSSPTIQVLSGILWVNESRSNQLCHSEVMGKVRSRGEELALDPINSRFFVLYHLPLSYPVPCLLSTPSPRMLVLLSSRISLAHNTLPQLPVLFFFWKVDGQLLCRKTDHPCARVLHVLSTSVALWASPSHSWRTFSHHPKDSRCARVSLKVLVKDTVPLPDGRFWKVEW